MLSAFLLYFVILGKIKSTFDFSKNTSNYNINVVKSVNEVKITAKPDCDIDDYEVKIDATTVNEDDKFRRTVSLNKEKDEIKIRVEFYILNINLS